MKIIFIAGPYIGDGKVETVEKNIRVAEKYQIALANAQVGFFCSHSHTEHFSTKKGATAPESFYRELDLEFLRKAADAVLAVPGWENSKGTIEEIKTAELLGLPVFYPKSSEPKDLAQIIEWLKN
ncbi:MAG: DUF4406 domain-containing protein [Patescibacteria group bacterium]|nr:DUF4406 domain-containing protein [Patescibacteria group bacterium]